MDIGRKIYYEKTNGVVILTKGEMSGSVTETSLEEDMEAYPVLTLIQPEQLGVMQLEYDELKEEFGTCNGYKINPENLQIEFVY